MSRRRRLHPQVVAEDDAAKPQPLLQFARARRATRTWRGDRRRGPAPSRARSSIEATSAAIARAERHPLDGVEPAAIVLDHRQGVDASRRSCRRARESACRTPRRRCPGGRGSRPPRACATTVRIVRQGAIADHGIRGIGEDVEHRRKVQVDPDGAEFGASAAAKRVASDSCALRPSVIAGGHTVNGALSRATRPPS